MALAAHAAVQVMVLGAVVLGLESLLDKRFPTLRNEWRARRGRRQILLVCALQTWIVVAALGSLTVISLLAHVFPDGDWQVDTSGIITMLAGTGLGAALALRLSLWWWRSTTPDQEGTRGTHSETKDQTVS